METPGSLGSFMDQLLAHEQRVHSDLRVYRWRPLTPELPALYNWMPTSTFALQDHTHPGPGGSRWRDSIRVLVRIAIRHSDIDEDMAELEAYADAFRDVIDAELTNVRPFMVPPDQTTDGVPVPTCRTAQRVGMNTVLDRFNDIDHLCIEFPITADIDRRP